jgi:hypothetical protein
MLYAEAIEFLLKEEKAGAPITTEAYNYVLRVSFRELLAPSTSLPQLGDEVEATPQEDIQQRTAQYETFGLIWHDVALGYKYMLQGNRYAKAPV